MKVETLSAVGLRPGPLAAVGLTLPNLKFLGVLTVASVTISCRLWAAVAGTIRDTACPGGGK
ncbi:hypothetical protein NBRC116594_18470 [Shimia sp. NS0008-38b]